MTHKAHYWNVILLQNVYSKMLEIVTGCFVFTAGRATWQITKKKKKFCFNNCKILLDDYTCHMHFGQL